MPYETYGFLTLGCNKFYYLFQIFASDFKTNLILAFLYILSFVFILSTTLVMIFKKEVDNSRDKGEDESKMRFKNYEDKLCIKSTYLLMWELLKLTSFKKLVIILLTMKVFSYYHKSHTLG